MQRTNSAALAVLVDFLGALGRPLGDCLVTGQEDWGLGSIQPP